MAQWILTSTGCVVPWCSVRILSIVKLKKESDITKRLDFDKLITQKFGDLTNLHPSKRKRSLSDADDYDYEYDPRKMTVVNPLDGLMEIPLKLTVHLFLKIPKVTL